MEKKRVLVVEDDAVIRENTEVFLQKSGYEVFTASNGMVGMQKAIALIPDLIVSDIIMPELNGYDLYKALQQIPETAIIPFVFVSSKGEAQDIRSAMQLGADDYLCKPFDFKELLSVIEIRIKKNEKLLKSSEKKFKALLNNNLTGVFLYKDDNIIFSNQKFQEITGYNEKELQDINFSALIYEKDKDNVFEKINIANEGLSNNIELLFSIVRKDNQLAKVKLFAGISKIQWKTIISAVVIEQNESQLQEIEKKEVEKLRNISSEYSKNFIVADKFQLQNSAEHLTKRELEVLQLTCSGLSNVEIAEQLYISTRTVEFHRSNLLGKTNTKNSTELLRFAVKNKLITI